MVFQLITRVIRGPPTSSFESAWRKWVGWCIGKNVDPRHCAIIASLNFLEEFFQAINQYRTAQLEERLEFNHKFVICLKGFFNSRPS